jgi:hypothetical protein
VTFRLPALFLCLMLLVPTTGTAEEQKLQPADKEIILEIVKKMQEDLLKDPKVAEEIRQHNEALLQNWHRLYGKTDRKAFLPNAPDVPTTTPAGIPFTATIRYNVDGVMLDVPVGYPEGWPDPENLGKVIKGEGLDVKFWMPTKRPVYIKDTPEPRPKEPGFPQAGDSEYTVYFRKVRFVEENDPSYLSPKQMFLNYSKSAVFSKYGDPIINDKNGLLSVAYPKDRTEIILITNKENSEPQVRLRCSKPALNTNPHCDGHVYYPSIKLGFYTFFIAEKLHEWRQIFDSTRDLILSWKALEQKP